MKKWFFDNIGEFCAIIPMALVVIFAYGCEATTSSILYPEKKVSRAELQIELDMYVALSKARFEDLRRQEEFRKFLFDQATAIGTGGTVNPVGVLTSLMAILGSGAIVDNRLKAKKLKNAKTSPPTA